MSNSSSAVHEKLIQLSASILDSLSRTPYTPPDGTNNISIKSILESLLPTQTSIPNPNDAESQLRNSIKDFALSCALLSASRSSTHDLLSWIPDHLSLSADSAFSELAGAYCVSEFGERNRRRVGELLPRVECGLFSEEKRLAVELMPEVLPLLKDRIKESCIDKDDKDGDEVSAASARTPVGFAIAAAYQFRWFVTQVDYPHLGKLCTLVIPAGLTALDHWSPEVKGQGMVSFIHLAKNVNAAELGWYEDVILDACCQNIVSADEIWHLVVEMSVLLVTQIQRSNPRSPWFERILNEMLGHLERQRRDMDRHIPWLTFIEPLFRGVGLVLLANFKRIFPLFFKWMHDGNDEIVLLVLKRIHLVMSLTWIRNTPYVERLVDELVKLYKEVAMRTAHEEIRIKVLEILVLLQQCKGLQFKAAWDKHKDDPNLATLSQSLCANGADDGSTHIKESQGNCIQWGSQPLTSPLV